MKSNLTFVKILSLVLCLALIFPSPIFADTANDYAGHWAEDSIKALYDKGFVTGYPDGTFKPEALISRAEFMAIINRAFDFNEKADISFKDVKEGEWHYEHVAKAVAAGYIKGFPDGTMRPTANISRQEAAVIIARILGLEENADTSVLANIKDADKIQQWSAKGISAVISNGYIKLNKENSFEPTKPLTRAEMAFAIEKSYVKHIKRTYAQPGIFTAGNVDGSVKIDNRDVTLLNSVINGDLILGEGIGDGDVHLINVTVKGETIVRGGGENSIVIENCQFSKIVIVKEDNKVRILAKGNTKVDKVDVQSGAKLETENLTGEGFGYVTIAEGLEGDALVELIGNFESVEVRAEGVKLQVSGGKIDNLAVANTAANVEIELSEDAKVTTLQAQAPAKVTGEGKIETAQVSVSGTKIEVPVTKVEAPSGVKVDTPKPTPAPSTPSTGGSGGGGSSRRDRDDDDDDKPTRVAVTGVEINKTSLTLKVGDEYQLIADVKPSNATNKAVTWNSDNEAVATVDSTGKVTAVGKGTANITVKTNDGGYTATCEVTVEEQTPEEPEVETANFEAINEFGIHDGKIYAGYELKDSEGNQIELVASKIARIEVKNPDGTIEELTVGDDNDPYLWFNVEKDIGQYEYTVETKEGKIYEAELDWTKEIKDATWEATKNEGEHEGVTYVEYELKDGERVSLKEGEVKLIAQKVEGKWVELTPNTDETLWFKKDKESGNYEFFVVTSEGTMYKATLLFVEPLTVTIDEITGKSNTLSGTFNKTVYLDETPLGSVDVSTKEGKIAFLNKLFNAPTDLGEYMDADKVDIELTDNSIKVTIQDGIISGEMFEAIDGDGNGVWRMDIVLNNDSFKDENGQTVEEEIEPFKIKFYVPFENNAANYDEPVKAVFQTQEQREEDEDPVVVEPLTVTIDEITGKSNTLSGTFNKTVYVDGKALGSVDVNSKEGKIAFLNKLFNAPTDLGEYMDADKVDIELTDNSIKVTIQDGIIKDGLFETLDADRDGIWRMDVVLNKENFLDENNQTVANDIEPFKIKFTSYKNQYGLGDLIDYTAESKAVFQTQAQRDAEPDKLEVTMTVEESTIAKSVVNMTTNLPIGTNLYEYPKNGLLTAFTKDGAFLLARLFKVDDDGNEQSVFFNNVFESVKIAPGPFNGIEYKANDTGRKGGDFGNTDQNGNLINNSTFLFENIRLNKSKYAGALTYNVKVDKKDFYSLWLPAGSININLNNEVKDNATSGSYVIYLEAYAPAYKDASQNLKWDDNDDLPLLEKVKVVEFTIDENASQQNMQKSHMENEKIIESEQFKELETEATIENDNLTNQKEEYEDEIDLENEENIVEEQAEDEKNMEGIDNVQENEKLMENEESDVEETEATGEQESNDGEMSVDENVSSVEGDTADEVAEDEGLTDDQKESVDGIDAEEQETKVEESFEEELVEDNDAEIEAEESANETEIEDEKDIEEEQVEDETDIENADNIVEEEEEL